MTFQLTTDELDIVLAYRDLLTRATHGELVIKIADGKLVDCADTRHRRKPELTAARESCNS